MPNQALKQRSCYSCFCGLCDDHTFKELAVHPWSLRFKDSRAEAGFAANLTTSAARTFIVVGLSSCAIQLNALTTLVVYLIGGVDNPEVNLIGTLAEVAMFLMTFSLIVIGQMQRCRQVLSPALMEVTFTVLMLLLLLFLPYSELSYAAALSGIPHSDPCGSQDIWILLRVDAIVTCTSLMPLRWKSVWVVNAMAIVWYPVCRRIMLGGIDSLWHYAWSIALLSIMAGFGKRSIEIQKRRLYTAVAKERTLRAELEFALSQRTDRSTTNPRPIVSIAPSYATGEMFDMTMGEESAAERFERIAATAHTEHWLIEPGSIRIDAAAMLGKGGFGAVFEGSMNRMPVAIKVALATDDESAKRTAELLAELRVLRKLRHPNIVYFHGAIVDRAMCEVALVLERVNGPTLGDFVKARGGSLEEDKTYSLTCGMVRAISYLHQHQPVVLHLDLKPSNVMVMTPDAQVPCAKVVDFGLSRIMSNSIRTLGGTLPWMAPELLQRPRLVSRAADVYGIGRISLFMLTGQEPFANVHISDIRRSLEAGDLPEADDPDHCGALGQQLWMLSEECIHAQPRDRPSADQVSLMLQIMARIPRIHDEIQVAAREMWGSFAIDADGSLLTGEQSEAQRRMPPELTLWTAAIPKLRETLARERKAATKTSSQSGAGTSRLPPIPEAPGERAPPASEGADPFSEPATSEDSCPTENAAGVAGEAPVTSHSVESSESGPAFNRNTLSL